MLKICNNKECKDVECYHYDIHMELDGACNCTGNKVVNGCPECDDIEAVVSEVESLGVKTPVYRASFIDKEEMEI